MVKSVVHLGILTNERIIFNFTSLAKVLEIGILIKGIQEIENGLEAELVLLLK